MMDKSKFFDHFRRTLAAPTLEQGEVDGANAILDCMWGLPNSWISYGLATAWHETAHTLQPIKESGGDAYFFRRYDRDGQHPAIAKQLGNTQKGDGVKFCGRGFVQLSGRANYLRAGTALKIDLISNPELALDPAIAAKIMRDGMVEGWFTGRKLAHILPVSSPATRNEFFSARRIINGSDRADLIAGYAMEFQHALCATEK